MSIGAVLIITTFETLSLSFGGAVRIPVQSDGFQFDTKAACIMALAAVKVANPHVVAECRDTGGAKK